MSDPQCKTDNLFNDREIMKKFKKSRDTPGRMDDGRYLTDYRNMTIVNELNKMEQKIVKNDMYRSYLVNNAEKEMKKNINDEKCNFTINTCIFNHKTARVDSSTFPDELKRYNESMNVNILSDFKSNCANLEDFTL